MSEFSLLAVFVVGLLGGVHCLGMCGSIVGMFTSQLPKNKTRWPFHVAYSTGRITSYAVAGALVGAVGQAGMLMRDQVPIQHLLFALSSVMLIVLGLYLAGLWGAVHRRRGARFVAIHPALHQTFVACHHLAACLGLGRAVGLVAMRLGV
jgi:sulfite exporter TauE/SafE